MPSPPRYLITGANHRSAAPAVRDRLGDGLEDAAQVLARLKAAGLTQALWLATCDRAEVLTAHPDPGQAEQLVAGVLAERADLPVSALAPHLHSLSDQAAVRHFCAVAAGLDSQVVGEPQVLGQVRAAYQCATAAGTLGPELDALVQAALAVARRVRAETAIGEGATSLAAALLLTARSLFGDLDHSAVLLLGLGDMGLFLAERLRESGIAHLTVMAMADARAERAARRLGVHHAPWVEYDSILPQADIVVTATGLGHYIVGAPAVTAALRQRRRRPVFLVDAAVPGDIDPAVAALDGAFVYDLADLEQVALDGQGRRQAAAGAAWALVDTAVATFDRERAGREAVPTLVALRRHFEAERRRLLAEQPGLDADAATRLLIHRLLHPPSVALRRWAADVASGDETMGPEMAERVLGRLFGLEEPAGESLKEDKRR